MNSDHGSTLNSSGNSSSSEAARNRFLDSLGLGANALHSLEECKTVAPKAYEGLVLSSQPELEEPENVALPSKGRAISISVNRGSAVNRSLDITLPASPKTEASGEPEVTAAPSAISGDDLDTILSLACPECAGDLVIKRRHLGVEGACVWCHTPIVAAETVRDRQVRVFPILGGIQKAETVEAIDAPIVREAAESIAVASSVPSQTLSKTAEPSLPAELDLEPSDAVLSEAQVSPEPADCPYSANFGFNPSFESATMEDRRAAGGFTPGQATTAPMDLEDLYSTTGFGMPAEEKMVEPGFGETLANPSKESATFNPAGFGAFLQSPVATADRNVDSSPIPWSTTNAPALPSSKPSAPETTTHDEGSPVTFGFASAVPSGFASPAPWGAPVKPADAGTAIDAPPSLINEATPVSNWASAFGNTSETGTSASAQNGNSLPEPLPTPSAFAGFGSAFGASMPVSEKPAAIEASTEVPSGFFFSSEPASKTLFGTSEPGSEPFAMPGHCFSTGSSSEPEENTFEALFTASSQEDGQSNIFEATETREPDGVPAALESIGGNAFFPSTNPDPALFGETPFDLFHDEPVAAPALPSSPVSAFSDLAPAPLPPMTGTEQVTTSFNSERAVAGTAAMPTLPLNHPPKPKPKVRKGFLILMVIIVGFASGGALASFVLPVEQYVETARAFMETKFNPAGVSPLPVSTGINAPSEITAP